MNLADAPDYLQLMREVALPDYRSTPGNVGAWCLHREEDGRAVFTMLTFWTDLDAVRAFAGDPVETAKYYGFDADFLIEAPPTVTHFEVAQ